MEVDFAAVMERVQRVIGEGVAFYEHQIARDEGITLFRGHARFLDEHRIDRDGETLEFEHALIAGGAPPHVPDLPGVVRSPIHDFHLFGPGVNKKTSVQNMGSATWTVRLTRGVSRYRCDPHRAIVHGSFTVS